MTKLILAAVFLCFSIAVSTANASPNWTGAYAPCTHEVASEDCSIQLVDGTPDVFAFHGGCSCAIARSQFPGEPEFQGWVAFNPMLASTPGEMFRHSVHEIGHLFGLHHNPDISSVMFFSDFGQDASLDIGDLKALASMHKLRRGILERKSQDGRIPITRASLKR
jgi:hypothetical protein